MNQGLTILVFAVVLSSFQSITGQKLMTLSREQLVKLTGMKVAPSLKIFEQIIKLKSMFPTPPPNLQADPAAR